MHSAVLVFAEAKAKPTEIKRGDANQAATKLVALSITERHGQKCSGQEPMVAAANLLCLDESIHRCIGGKRSDFEFLEEQRHQHCTGNVFLG